MEPAARPIIVGAGPVGLAAALFLARDGVPTRLIDAAQTPSTYSRALAVNPRTLEILEPTGITAEMLSIGEPIHGVHFWHENRTVAEVSFRSLHHRFPFMLALSQAVTVRLLDSALNRLGGHVERGTELLSCRNDPTDVAVNVKRLTDDAAEMARCPWLLAADGSRSAARRSLSIPFEGSAFEVPWSLVDVPLETSLPEDAAHILFLENGGFLFLLRVVGEPTSEKSVAPVWRVMGNVPDLLTRLHAGKAVGPAIWTSTFHISHRINERLADGRVYFAGDSAHVHSPVGARGMNLGIEDAWVFSRLHREGKLDEYGPLRHKVDRRVVRRIELISRLARGESSMARALRERALPVMSRIPATRNRMIETVTGLDHPL